MEKTVIEQRYQRWLTRVEEPALREELLRLQGQEDELQDRFYKDLAFGTGGLRGQMGAGTNRMNLYTVGKATQGLAAYLQGQCAAPSACIAYDTRNNSQAFAQRAAQVLCAGGVKVYLYESVRPTPMLSFAVRHLGASAGVVVTASHNPKEYNGYKVYGADGGQITDAAAAAILAEMDKADLFDGVRAMPLDEAREAGLLRYIGEEVDRPYFAAVEGLALRKELLARHAGELRILYSPLHGTGNLPVRRVLRELGFAQVEVVREQELPNGNFPTAPYPNPEEPAVFGLAIQAAQSLHPELIFATDPDCDRIGVLVKNPAGEYTVLTGNQTGALLCEYILCTHRELGTMPQNPAVIKTIVTSDLGKRICQRYGAAMPEVLTGFKYIGELAQQWEQTGEHSFLLGFEESYGYLTGNFVRDKDGVIAAALIAEMALYYKTQGKTLYDALQALYETYGYYKEKLLSVAMPGQSGQEKIREIIARLRSQYQQLLPAGELAFFEDYKASVRRSQAGGEEALTLPKSNVLKFVFTDQSWFVVRPSGTEPKIKLYLSAVGQSEAQAQARLAGLEALARKVLA